MKIVNLSINSKGNLAEKQFQYVLKVIISNQIHEIQLKNGKVPQDKQELKFILNKKNAHPRALITELWRSDLKARTDIGFGIVPLT